MGLLSKIVKGAKNILKGTVNLFKRAYTEVKRFVTSDLGRAVVASAAIYFGGQALGAWGGGTTVNAAVPVVDATMAAAAAPTTAIPVDFGAGLLDAVPAVPAATEGVAPAVATAPGVAAQAPGAFEATKGAATGVIDKVSAGAKAYEAWAKANPLTAKIVGQTLASLTAEPDPNQALEVEKWRRSNMNVAGVDVGGTGAGALSLPQLKRTTRYVDAQPGGLVSRANRST
jgi:hypothetical protein